jgi:DNA helicase II / ATP-dependent DNA helicase PcrA
MRALAELVEGLDPAQARAVEAPPTPLVVVAGAGSGKTTVLTRRIAYQVRRGDVAARNILAVTHTTKSAGEVHQRLAHLDPGLRDLTCSTVHAAAWRVVRRFHAEAGFPAEPDLVSSTLPLVRDAVRRATGSKLDPAEVVDLASELEWAAASSVTATDYPEAAARTGRVPPLPLSQVADILTVFGAIKRERNIVDFGDVLSIGADLLDHPDVAPKIRAGWRAVVVDEFQDTDRAQARFLAAIRDGRPLWTVVGDPRQTIYSFKGADPLLLREAMREPNVEVVHLASSWRCSSEVLGWANAAIGTSYGPALTSESSGPPPVLTACGDVDDEARRVVDQLRSWRSSGIRFDEMAVLFRFNASSARLEVACAEAQIPYSTGDGKSFFHRADVLEVLRPFGARARQNPEADGNELLGQIAATVGYRPGDPPEGTGAARARWESLRSLLEIGASCSDQSASGMLDELLDLAQRSGTGGVWLSTIHAAKGLEWRAVCVLGASEGTLPSLYATTQDQVEEERRLFYVALTRAERNLVVFSPSSFKNRPLTPSRFLKSLPGIALADPRPKGRYGSKARRSTSRASNALGTPTGRPSSADPTPPTADRRPLPGLDCAVCGGRLSSLAARAVKRCGPGCLDGKTRSRFDALVHWQRASEVDIPERELFHLAATGKTGPRWPARIQVPDLD